MSNIEEYKEPEFLFVRLDVAENRKVEMDEIVFLYWLIQTSTDFYFVEFSFSMELLRSNLKVKRYRMRTILKKYSDMGVLKTRVKLTPYGSERYFDIDYIALSNNTDKIFKKDSRIYNEFKERADFLQTQKVLMEESRYEEMQWDKL